MAKRRLDVRRRLNIHSFTFLTSYVTAPLQTKWPEDFQVYHDSPQYFVITKGECIYEDSHNGISMRDIKAELGSGD